VLKKTGFKTGAGEILKKHPKKQDKNTLSPSCLGNRQISLMNLEKNAKEQSSVHKHYSLETEECDDSGVNKKRMVKVCFCLQQKDGLPKRRTARTPPCGA
jgi:flagellar biosynthesis chaperone FliJ